MSGILWLLKTNQESSRDIAVIRALAETDHAELGRLRNSIHDLRDLAQATETRLTVLEDRLDART